jgi:hypothetical protein
MSETFELGLLVLLASESAIFMMLGIIVLRRNIKNLANHFFASLFFIAAASTFINLLAKTFYQNEIILVVLYNIVGLLWLNSFIVISAGFAVINLGQKYFLEKRGRLWFFVIISIFSVGMFIFQPGISYTSEYNGIYFIVSIPLGIYFLILITISTIFSGISILKTLQKANKKQKAVLYSFLVAVLFYWIAISMTMLVDMRVVPYRVMDVTLIFYFIGLLLFFMSLMAPRKK